MCLGAAASWSVQATLNLHCSQEVFLCTPQHGRRSEVFLPRSIMTQWGDGVAESSPGKEGKSAAVFWVFFGMCWEVRGRSKRQGMHSKDHTAQSYLKLCFGYYNGHIVSGFASVTTATNWQNTMLIVKTFFLKFVLIWPRKTWLFLPEAQFLSYAKYMCLPSCWDYSSFLI